MWEANHCLISLPENAPCNMGLGTEEGEGILATAPAAAGPAKNGDGLSMKRSQSAIAGFWGSSLIS